MRGLWTKETKKLAMDVAQGNPGAFRVIDELLYFSDWYDMMKWCLLHGKVGPKLWEKFKDEFNQDALALGDWIKRQMWHDRMDKSELRNIRGYKKSSGEYYYF